MDWRVLNETPTTRTTSQFIDRHRLQQSMTLFFAGILAEILKPTNLIRQIIFINGTLRI